MKVCIHQPDFAPYLGFFHRLLLVDLYLVLDDVQFLRRGWHHRDKIKTREGETWITLSVERGPRDQRIMDVELSPDPQWRQDNLNLLRHNYQAAPHFKTYFPRVEALYRQGHTRMVDFNMAMLDFLMEVLEVRVRRVFSSDHPVESRSTQRLVDLLRKVGGTHYLSGTGARAYMEPALFEQAGITLEWQQFTHPVYPQLFGPFIPYLSTLDLVFNCGPQSAQVLRSTLSPPSPG